MTDSMNENVIEFLRGQKVATVTLASNTRLNSRVRKLAAEKPDECQISAENSDGSIVAHVPVKWIKISPPRQMSEEQREALRERAAKFGFQKKKNSNDEPEDLEDLEDLVDSDDEEFEEYTGEDDDLFD